MTNSVLVVGGAGLLGRSIVDSLLEKGHTQLAILDVAALPDGQAYAAVEQFQGSLTDSNLVARAVQGRTVIVHTASPPHGLAASVYFDVNVRGTETLLAACRKAHVRALVYTSSASVVYNGSPISDGREDELPYCAEPMDAYNETKALAEKLVLDANCPELRTCALRPSGIFGPRDRQCVAGFMAAARAGKAKFQVGPNQTLFDYTYIANVVHAHILALERLPADERLGGQAFNVTNGEPVGFWDMPRRLWQLVGCAPTRTTVIPFWVAFLLAYVLVAAQRLLAPIVKFEPTFTPFRVRLMQADRYFSIEKAQRLLGYKPVVSLDEGLRLTAAWVRTSGL